MVAVRTLLLACAAYGLSACSMLSGSHEPGTIDARGVDPTLEQMGIASTMDAQDKLLGALMHTAGLPTQPPLPARDPNWSLVWKAGVYEVGRQCDQYLDSLFRFNRRQRAGREGLAAAAGASGAIMGIAGASVPALAITAASFGLVNNVFAANVNSILFTIEPSALRNVAQKGLQSYLKGIDGDKIQTRPDMLIALQGYLTQCSPAAIEANINNAASGAPSVASMEPGVAEKAAALAAPSVTAAAAGIEVRVVRGTEAARSRLNVALGRGPEGSSKANPRRREFMDQCLKENLKPVPTNFTIWFRGATSETLDRITNCVNGKVAAEGGR